MHSTGHNLRQLGILNAHHALTVVNLQHKRVHTIIAVHNVLQLLKLWNTGQIAPATPDILFFFQIAADCLVIHTHAWCSSNKTVSNHSVINYLHMWKVQRHQSFNTWHTDRIKKMTKQYQLVQTLNCWNSYPVPIQNTWPTFYAFPVNTHTIYDLFNKCCISGYAVPQGTIVT